MSEFHVKVIRVGEVTKNPNADRLWITRVPGTEYSVQFVTDEYKPGDLAVYVPFDSVVPADDPRWSYLNGKTVPVMDPPGYRIKAMRLKGLFSTGVYTKPDPGMQEGDDAVEALRIRKYEPPENLEAGLDDERDPGFLPVYTDIAGLRAHPGVFVEGEEVILTEKIHGCVPSNTLITMLDGSRQRITAIKVGDVVLGVDEAGKVTPSKVTATFANGAADKWLRVTGRRRGAGRGSSYFSVRCTPQHKFWNPQTKLYSLASDLGPGSPVLLLRSEFGLTPVQEQVLLGKMLGDGSLVQNDYTALVQWSHRQEDRAYADWTARAIGSLAAESEGAYTSGYGTEMVHRRTVSNVWVKALFGSMVEEDGPKRVPSWVSEALTPLAVAFWYMDDGSLTHAEGQEDRAAFAVCGFTEADCDVLTRGLARLGVVATYYESEGYPRLRLSSDNAERLFLLIAPYVPPCMQRKLPERYQGHEGWLPPSTQEYKPALVEQVIDSVEVDKTVRSDRYDIETETHNYFAHGVLVHNSNGRFLYKKDRLWVASRTNVKRLDSNTEWTRLARDLNMAERLKAVPDIAIYGEACGQVKGFTYGTKGLKFLMFDACNVNTRQYLDYDDVVALAKQLGFDMVPELYRGPWSKDLASYADGKTTLAGTVHIREGFVVRPVKERYSDFVGRVILKRHGEEFLLKH